MERREGDQPQCCSRRTRVARPRPAHSAEVLRYDVDVSGWVTPTAYEEGYYTKLYRALDHWFANGLPFEDP